MDVLANFNVEVDVEFGEKASEILKVSAFVLDLVSVFHEEESHWKLEIGLLVFMDFWEFWEETKLPENFPEIETIGEIFLVALDAAA